MDGDLISLFSNWQRHRGYSPQTVKRRAISIRSFITFVEPLTLLAATGVNVDDWVDTLRAARTKHAYRSDLSCFYAWAVRRQLTEVNPVHHTDPIRLARLLPRPVPPEHIPLLLASAPDDDVRLMIALAAFAGLRRAEIASLRTSDVSLFSDPPMLVVRKGKGGHDRVVSMHPSLVALLERRRASGQVFACDAAAVGRRVAHHLRAFGLDATCHQLRHSFGTELARVSDGNVILVKEALGHADVSTTMGYIAWCGGNGAVAIAKMYR